jgi:hypothetical protein
MNISENYKAIIVNEINFIINKMDESKTAEDKIFYFSAINAVFQRIFNIEYDPDLVFAFIILRDTHNHFSQRLQSIRKQVETTVLLTEEQFSRLSDLTRELSSKIERNENIDDTLKKYVILYYTTTGNGYYLFQKGLIRI